MGETVDIESLSPTLRGTVDNSGKIHAGTLSLSNLEAFRNTSSTAEVLANTAHLSGVRIGSAPEKLNVLTGDRRPSTLGKMEFQINLKSWGKKLQMLIEIFLMILKQIYVKNGKKLTLVRSGLCMSKITRHQMVLNC